MIYLDNAAAALQKHHAIAEAAARAIGSLDSVAGTFIAEGL